MCLMNATRKKMFANRRSPVPKQMKANVCICVCTSVNVCMSVCGAREGAGFLITWVAVTNVSSFNNRGIFIKRGSYKNLEN